MILNFSDAFQLLYIELIESYLYLHFSEENKVKFKQGEIMFHRMEMRTDHDVAESTVEK